MVKCPFCGFMNEDGALFCEQCKSDLSGVPSQPMTPPSMPPTPMPESLPVATFEAIPMAEIEAVPMAEVEAIPMAAVEASPFEDIPMAAVEVAPEPPAAPLFADPDPVPPANIPVPPLPEPVAHVPPPAPPAPPPPAPVSVPAVAVAAAPLAAAPAPSAAPAASGGSSVPAGSSPKLSVLRGVKVGEEFPIFPGENYVGRADDKPVDMDLTFQEPEDRVWVSRQHALIVFDDATGTITLEDLNSSNGTFVNRARVYPGQPRNLFVNDTVQIGTVHLRLKV
jgi:hypothetical protein